MIICWRCSVRSLNKTEELKKLIKDYHLEDRVIYHGPIPAKKASAYFASADALYVSLAGDGYVGKTIPNKLVMSLAFGKPIIGVLEGDGKAILESAGGGIVAQANKESIAKAIEQMAELPNEQRKKLGQLNQAYYSNNLSVKHIGEMVNDTLLKELL